jgi:hypothetical protein
MYRFWTFHPPPRCGTYRPIQIPGESVHRPLMAHLVFVDECNFHASAGFGDTGEPPLHSATSRRMWISSGSPSPSRSRPFTTASAVSSLASKVSWLTLLVPFTNAATVNGLPATHAADADTSTPSIVLASRQPEASSGQNGSGLRVRACREAGSGRSSRAPNHAVSCRRTGSGYHCVGSATTARTIAISQSQRLFIFNAPAGAIRNGKRPATSRVSIIHRTAAACSRTCQR